MTATPLRAVFDGTTAVWIFFVLSGYVLARRFWRGQQQHWGRYAVRRTVRLYVPFWGSAVLALGLLWVRRRLEGAGGGILGLAEAGTSPGGFAADLGLFGMTGSSVNTVWWSMRWEVWFSALLPLLLIVLAIAGCGPHRRFRFAPVVFAVACVIVAALHPLLVRTFDMPLLWQGAPRYLPMFGVGVALAAYERPIVSFGWWRRPGRAWATLGLALLLLGMRGPFGALEASGTFQMPVTTGIGNALAIIGAALVVALCIGWPAGVRALSTRPVEWVGVRSYSLYLIHLPLLEVLTVLFAMDSAPVWFVVLVLVSSTVLAGVFHRLVEAPATRLASRLGRPRSLEPATRTPRPENPPVETRSPVGAH